MGFNSLVKSNITKSYLLLFSLLIFIILLGFLFSHLLKSSFILYFAIFFSIFSAFGSYWWSDKIVLAIARAKPLAKEENLRVYQIVEKLAKSSGIYQPKIYLLPETQPNAFATGRNQKNSVIALTEGLIQKLDDEELEGVIAHELSHIKNRDILLGTIVVVLVGIVVWFSNLFLRISFWTRISDDEERGSLGIVLMILGIICAILAPIAASLIQLAISRKREFLADADGSLMTKNPEGLISALKKIAKDQTQMRRVSNSTAHLFIASPFKGKQKNSLLVKLFMTHPPVEERIKALRKLRI